MRSNAMTLSHPALVSLKKIIKLASKASAKNAGSDDPEDEQAWKAFQFLENLEAQIQKFIEDVSKEIVT
jgi:hypothetical protein